MTEEDPMFEEFSGIPMHPLLVHAAVVFVPLLGLVAVGYAFVPMIRPHLRWVLAALAVMAPGAALFAKLSGDAFFDRGIARGQITEGFIPVIEEHQSFGTMTLIWTIVLGVAALALVYVVAPRAAAMGTAVTSGPAWRTNPILQWGLAAVVTVLAAISFYYVFKTGDSGAKAVWDGR
ncbi:hypothetical protein [Virgisporangium ochraceum]|nr:hypothetical protein [Virgisporangium ochraceum]